MRMKVIAVFASALVLSGCSSGGDGEQAPADQPATDSPAEAAEAAPVPPVEPAAAETAGFANTAVSACPSDQGVYCYGPVLVRAKNITLSKDGRSFSDGAQDLVATVTFTVENRTDSPIRFNMLSREVTRLSLRNGVEMQAARSRNSVSGLTPCDRPGPDCLNASPGDFVVLTPGESPANFNVIFGGRADPSLASSVPRVETADVNVQIFVAGAGGANQKVQASFPDVPIFNNLAN